MGTDFGVAAKSSQRSSTNGSFSAGVKSKMDCGTIMIYAPSGTRRERSHRRQINKSKWNRKTGSRNEVGFDGAMPTRPCRHPPDEAYQSLTRDTARDREFETWERFVDGGDEMRESRAKAGETRPACDAVGNRCEESRSNEKSRRVSTAAFWFTLRSVLYEPVGFSCVVRMPTHHYRVMGGRLRRRSSVRGATSCHPSAASGIGSESPRSCMVG